MRKTHGSRSFIKIRIDLFVQIDTVIDTLTTRSNDSLPLYSRSQSKQNLCRLHLPMHIISLTISQFYQASYIRYLPTKSEVV